MFLLWFANSGSPVAHTVGALNDDLRWTVFFLIHAEEITPSRDVDLLVLIAARAPAWNVPGTPAVGDIWDPFHTQCRKTRNYPTDEDVPCLSIKTCKVIMKYHFSCFYDTPLSQCDKAQKRPLTDNKPHSQCPKTNSNVIITLGHFTLLTAQSVANRYCPQLLFDTYIYTVSISSFFIFLPYMMKPITNYSTIYQTWSMKMRW